MEKFAGVFVLCVLLNLISFSQAKEGIGFLDKGKTQVGFSMSDFTSAGAYGAQAHFRVGYFLLDKLEGGLDMNFGVRDYGITYGSFGPFAKYHILNNWYSPYVVVSADYGLCDFTDNRVSAYQSGKLSWGKYFVGAGLGFYGINDHWGFETAIGYQQENYIREDIGSPEFPINQWTIPIKWRISYSF